MHFLLLLERECSVFFSGIKIKYNHGLWKEQYRKTQNNLGKIFIITFSHGFFLQYV